MYLDQHVVSLRTGTLEINMLLKCWNSRSRYFSQDMPFQQELFFLGTVCPQIKVTNLAMLCLGACKKILSYFHHSTRKLEKKKRFSNLVNTVQKSKPIASLLPEFQSCPIHISYALAANRDFKPLQDKSFRQGSTVHINICPNQWCSSQARPQLQ